MTILKIILMLHIQASLNFNEREVTEPKKRKNIVKFSPSYAAKHREYNVNSERKFRK